MLVLACQMKISISRCVGYWGMGSVLWGPEIRWIKWNIVETVTYDMLLNNSRYGGFKETAPDTEALKRQLQIQRLLFCKYVWLKACAKCKGCKGKCVYKLSVWDLYFNTKWISFTYLFTYFLLYYVISEHTKSSKRGILQRCHLGSTKKKGLKRTVSF